MTPIDPARLGTVSVTPSAHLLAISGEADCFVDREADEAEILNLFSLAIPFTLTDENRLDLAPVSDFRGVFGIRDALARVLSENRDVAPVYLRRAMQDLSANQRLAISDLEPLLLEVSQALVRGAKACGYALDPHGGMVAGLAHDTVPTWSIPDLATPSSAFEIGERRAMALVSRIQSSSMAESIVFQILCSLFASRDTSAAALGFFTVLADFMDDMPRIHA